MTEIQTFIASRTADDFYVFGTIVGFTLATIGVTAWIKRHYLRKNAKKLASEFVVLNVTFWGFVSTIASFLITQGTQFAPLLPYVSSHWAQISGGAILIHAVATALHKWWKSRKNNEALVQPAIELHAELEKAVDISRTPKRRPTADLWNRVH